MKELTSILLADDDDDDCLFFKEALEELQLPARLSTVHDGEQLIHLLAKKTKQLPHILFLDLNMPRKNGFECLTEIRQNQELKQLTVVIFSTSFQQDVVDLLYESGAQYYVRKPADFQELKKVIDRIFAIIKVTVAGNRTGNLNQPAKENFVLL